MKIYFLGLLFIYSTVQGQELKNSEWIQVKIEKKDGSKFWSHARQSISKYYFKENTVLITDNNRYLNELNYSVDDHILSIGDFIKFQIDTFYSRELVVTEIPRKEVSDDKINRLYFINSNFIFKAPKDAGQIEVTKDSLIETNQYLIPTYYGNLDSLFMQEFGPHANNKVLDGRFNINGKGEIDNIKFDQNNKFSKKDLASFERLINSTNKAWVSPRNDKNYAYRINFQLLFSYSATFWSVQFIYMSNTSQENNSLSLDKSMEANSCFTRGNNFIENKKYDKAIKQFERCIAIDELYFDAYYNLAHCYLQIDMKNLACETWNKLKNLGQKQGEYMFEENCK